MERPQTQARAHAGKATSTKAGQGWEQGGEGEKGEGGGVKACVSCHSLLDPTNTPLVRWNTNPVFFNDVNPPDDYIRPGNVIKEHLQGPFFLSFSRSPVFASSCNLSHPHFPL